MNIPELQNLLGSPLDEAPTSRRDALRKTGKLGAGLALAALPAAILPKVSFAQDGPPSVVDVLNYALTIEYLEESYYRQALDNGVIPDGEVAAFSLPAEQELKHVNFLTAAIEAAGGTPVEFTDDDFNFDALGTDPLEEGNYDFFLLLLMGFEDLGVRAYKGAAPFIPRDLDVAGVNVLTAALQLHAIESRHSSYVRFERAERGAAVAPWVLLDSQTDGTPLEAIYGAGTPADAFPPEENVIQAGVDVSEFDVLDGLTESAAAATASGTGSVVAHRRAVLGPLASVEGVDPEQAEAAASFDEPLDMDTVLSIASPFLAE